MASFSNIDRTDLEMLHIVNKARGFSETTTAEEIADELGLPLGGKDGLTSVRRITPRLSWMARYGLLYKTKPDVKDDNGHKRMRWGLTKTGETLINGRLRRSISDALETGDEGEQLLIMRRLMQRGYVEGGLPIAAALRREFAHHSAQRRLI